MDFTVAHHRTNQSSVDAPVLKPSKQRTLQPPRRADMEEKLSDVAMEGSLKKLHDLIQQDPLVLDRALVHSCLKTPLLIAAMLDHLDLVKTLLNGKPEFATELDSHGSTPLHLTAAKGHVGVVRELLWADVAVCLVKNQNGRTALHVAAVKGRVEVVRGELVRARTELIWASTDREESIGKVSQLVNLKDAIGNPVDKPHTVGTSIMATNKAEE